MDSIEQEILRELKRLVGGEPKAADSLALIGIDSIGMAELSFEMEKKFNIQVDEDVLDVDTVGDFIQYVRDKSKA